MQVIGIPSLFSLLVALTSITQTASSSVPKLARRHDSHAPFTDVYIMRQKMDYSHGPLKIYRPDGDVIFQFSKSMQDPIQGVSKTTIMDHFSQAILLLESKQDICALQTNYNQADPGWKQREFTIYPRGILPDVWVFNYVDSSGQRRYFKLERDALDKEGKIYEQIKGKNGDLVARLKDEVRTDPWLTAGTGSDEVATYTLLRTDDSPQPSPRLWAMIAPSPPPSSPSSIFSPAYSTNWIENLSHFASQSLKYRLKSFIDCCHTSDFSAQFDSSRFLTGPEVKLYIFLERPRQAKAESLLEILAPNHTMG
ncbi:hypothetical protein MJO29_008406 [Puccinia striiformis f. sp. tritici]|nr:hypothetical protein MJO29_008406 [Puccinia striiformis f. sp. tritici]